MISIEKEKSIISGTPKEICKELTYLIVHFIKALEKDYNISQNEAILIVNECCKIAYMEDDDRKKYLDDMNGGEEDDK